MKKLNKSGWFFESERHALARRGIKTATHKQKDAGAGAGKGMFYPNQIPALTLSGGKLSEFGGKALEYRVWVHPKEGSDSYYRFDSLQEASEGATYLRKTGKYAKVEIPLAVVKSKGRFREVAVNYPKHAEVEIMRKIKLASGGILTAKLYGVRGGDLSYAMVKHNGKWVELRSLPIKRIFPFKVMTKTPFVDVDVVSSRDKKKEPEKPHKSVLDDFLGLK